MFASLLGTLIDFTTCYRCLGLCSRNGDGPLSRHFEEDRFYQRLTEYNQAPYLHEICGYFWLTSNILCSYRLGQGDRSCRAIRGCGPPCSLLPLLPRLHFLTLDNKELSEWSRWHSFHQNIKQRDFSRVEYFVLRHLGREKRSCNDLG